MATDDTSGQQMQTPAKGEPAGILSRLALARFALAWEDAWPRLWPAAMVSGVFVASAFSGLYGILPTPIHALLLAGFVITLLFTLWQGARGLGKSPSLSAARARVECDSRLSHRPLTTLHDRLPPGASAEAEAVWQAHLLRVQAGIGRLRISVPRPNIARRDPLAFRFLLLLALLVTGVFAGSDWQYRLKSSLMPGLRLTAAAQPAQLDLWINPPGYTGLPPLLLSVGNKAQPPPQSKPGGDGQGKEQTEISIPAGSALLARLTGGWGVPQLLANGVTQPFDTVKEGGFTADAILITGSQIKVSQNGSTLGGWNISLIPDQPPVVAFAATPSATRQGALQIKYQARDDYGIEALWLTIMPMDPIPGEDNAPLTLPLPLSGTSPRQVQQETVQDLTANPWAGRPVQMTLTAKDAANQTGDSETIVLTLPERPFHHPVASAIIEQRRRLPGDETAYQDIAGKLSYLSVRPGAYANDLIAFLALRSAVARLILNPVHLDLAALRSLLWDTAIRIEDGRTSSAARELRAAEQALASALERNAPDEEIRRLTELMKQAMNRFLQEMERRLAEMLARGENPPLSQTDPDQRVLTREQLQHMADRINQLSQTGARDAARQALEQLRQITRNLRASMRPSNQARVNQAQQMDRALRDLIDEQRQLLDQTFRRSQSAEDGQDTNGQEESAALQEALRRRLGEIMRRMGELSGAIPDDLGQAEQAMRRAQESLGQGRSGEAVPQQAGALTAMQKGLRGFAEKLAQQAGEGQGGDDGDGDGDGEGDDTPATAMPVQPGGRPGVDPLGREINGRGTTGAGQVRIPDAGEIQRSRAILDELRRRSGDTERPKVEREYIDRLLRRFSP